MNSIEFILYSPKSPIAFDIFGYPIRYYGLIIAFSLIVGFCFICKFLKNNISSEDSSKFVDYSVYVIIFAIFGARLFYVLGSLDYYVSNPSELIMVNHGGISIWGAIIFGILGLFILSKIYKFSFFLHSSVIAIFMSLCQAIGRWGNYFNQEAFGAPSNLFIKLYISPENRPSDLSHISYFHPAFLYESILDFIIFLILYSTFNKNNPSKTFYLYIILYSTARILVESVRIDSVLNVKSVPIAIIISILAIIFSIFGLISSLKKLSD